MKKDNHLTTQSIPKLIQQIAIPASVGFFFYTMFNVVDTYFAGLISTEALAALSLSFPVFFIIIAMGSGLSTGTTAVIATALGAGNQRPSFALKGRDGLQRDRGFALSDTMNVTISRRRSRLKLTRPLTR